MQPGQSSFVTLEQHLRGMKIVAGAFIFALVVFAMIATFARGGEIICEECDEEFAEHRLHYNDVRGVNFVQLCHDCFSKSHIQQHA